VIDFIPQALAGSGAGRALEVVVGALMLAFWSVHWYGWSSRYSPKVTPPPCSCCLDHCGMPPFLRRVW